MVTLTVTASAKPSPGRSAERGQYRREGGALSQGAHPLSFSCLLAGDPPNAQRMVEALRNDLVKWMELNSPALARLWIDGLIQSARRESEC